MNNPQWTPAEPVPDPRHAALLQPRASTVCRRFEDRTQAGRALAEVLMSMDLKPPLLVLALPRGGVPVAAQVARTLKAPLDLLLVRKIGAPTHPELAVAAVVEGSPPDVIFNPETADLPGVNAAYIESMLPAALREIERRRMVYLKGRAPHPMADATVIVVDDGIATGTTMKAALQALRQRRPARLIVAVPVAPYQSVVTLSDEADDVICLVEPRPFRAIGLHYLDFHQLSDGEVCEALADADAEASRASQPNPSSPDRR
ncbi:MAG: phosphoribosyltransferase [Betaproteobacteria bacterium HGW-Betaproteobacteria-16]|nr:MAG: phosphoribosyltransferase [Betaproteobacteria bacterium HGW-Betaproteobacteria-16]